MTARRPLRSLARAALAAGLWIARATAAEAQEAHGRLIGTARVDDVRPLAGALVRVAGRAARTDSAGRFEIAGLPAGTHRVVALALGRPQRDTTITLAAEATVRWDPAFPSLEVLARAADSANRVNGVVDSAGTGRVRADPRLAAAYRSFTIRFARALLLDRPADSNVVVSPISARLALGMVAAGARGATAGEMTALLHGRAVDPAALAPLDSGLLARLRGRADVALEVANALWLDPQLPPVAPFVRTARQAYGAEVHAAPLASPRTLDAVNRWVREATRGRIAGFRDEPFPPDTRAFVANAVYFKGKWLIPFERHATRPRDFHLSRGGTLRVPMMERTGRLAFAQRPGYRMVRLPYRAGLAALYVLLPDSGLAPEALLRRFSIDDWPPTLTERDARDVHLVLPRLRLAQTSRLDSALKALGMSRAYDCERADFGALSPAGPLCIGEATQKVFLQLDEEGTEAAAVTGVTVQLVSAQVNVGPSEFVVDRPFLILLRDERTGVDLFVGRIARPTAE